MGYQAIYRKWRPLIFEDIVGQTHITTTLKNQILTNKIAHAYLFCGTRGTGKTTAAKVFARAVNCENNTQGSPCNICETCKGILDGSIIDVVEIDAASNNGVDNIREIRDEVAYLATQTRYKVYIIDEVHMLSSGAFNALLKTLEEPPEHVIFILATTEAHKVPQTILSRCQRFDFKRIKPSDIIVRMKEIALGDQLDVSDDGYALLARLADGSMRDALSILERCVSSCGTKLTAKDITDVLGIAANELVFQITDSIIQSDTEHILKAIDMLLADGRDLHTFIDTLIRHFRDLMVCKVSHEPESILDYSADELVRVKAQAQKLSFEKISNATTLLSNARAEAKWMKAPRVIYELSLIKLTRPELDDSKEALLDRLNSMEDKVKNGIAVKSEPPAAKKPDKKIEKKPEKKVSERLFKPLASSQMHADHPFVIAAKKWDRIAKSITKTSPHLAAALSRCSITIDGDGIIMMYEKQDAMSKNIANTFVNVIQDSFNKAAGTSMRIKIAFKHEIEDMIVDIWSLPAPSVTSDIPPDADGEPAHEHVPKINGTDPLDTLSDKFPEIVEFTDDSDFVNYETQDDSFSQSTLDQEDSEDDTEEFLEDNEKND